MSTDSVSTDSMNTDSMNTDSERAKDGYAVARAFANIALVKYWGKRNVALNLPATGSLSLTLDPLATYTEVTVDDGLEQDEVWLNGEKATGRAASRVSGFVDLLRDGVHITDQPSGAGPRVRVRSHNTFPTAAGLASSASAFAALTVATGAAFGHDLSPAQASILARRGSGSAARSIFGGFVEMDAGEEQDGSDAFANPLAPAEAWPLAVVIGVIQSGPKKVSSTVGMDQTVETSPYFPSWADCVPPDLDGARKAIESRDFELLAQVAERSCLRMHASAIAADPGVLYWQGPTVDAVHAVRAWRADGLPCFFTIDAGPNIKVFCPADQADAVASKLAEIPGIADTIRCTGGGPAILVDQYPEA